MWCITYLEQNRLNVKNEKIQKKIMSLSRKKTFLFRFYRHYLTPMARHLLLSVSCRRRSSMNLATSARLICQSTSDKCDASADTTIFSVIKTILTIN